MQEKGSVPAIRFTGFMDDWEQRKLRELVSEFQSGKFINASEISESGQYPVYGGNGLRGYTDHYNHDGEFVLIGRQGALCGNVNKSLGKAYFTEHAVVVKGNEDNDTDFLFHLFFTMNLGQYSDQSAQPGLAVGKLSELKTMVPKLSEQRVLSGYFSNLDHLITLHQRKYSRLCNIKKFMLERMFPREGATVPEIRFAGFTYAWEQHKLGEFSDIKTGPFGSTLHADDYINDGMPIITTEHFKSGQLPTVKDGIPQVSDDDYFRLSSYILNTDDIVFSRVGSVDINALVTPFQDKWLFSGRVLRVRPYTEVDSMFLHTLLETNNVRNDIVSRAVGQTMPSINTEILKITSLCLPQDIDEQRKIGEYFHCLDRLITLHQRELERLQNIKKACLEKMFV